MARTTENLDLQPEERKKYAISVVWIVPILAGLVAATVGWQSYISRGLLIEIQFKQGHGFTAGNTVVKHNDIVVGKVEEVTLSESLETVIVKARMKKVIEPYLGDTTVFSAVNARLSGLQLSGLDTLLSGAFIKVEWSEKPDSKQRSFVGLDLPPLTPSSVAGTQFELKTEVAGSVGVGSPIFYRNIQVGKIESRKLADDFSHIDYEGFIEAPYDSLISNETQFWDISGVDIEAGTSGLRIKLESLSALLTGGVTFGDFSNSHINSDLEEIDITNHQFVIYPNESAAKESIYQDTANSEHLFMAKFESMQGLEPGAPVQWEGIRVGTVREVVINMDSSNPFDTMYAVLEFQPHRIGMGEPSRQELNATLKQAIQNGVRAQLTTSSLLSGSKIVNMTTSNRSNARFDETTLPYPTIPTVPSDLTAVTNNIDTFVASLADLPLNELMEKIIDLVSNADTLLDNPDVQSLPNELGLLMESLARAAGDVQIASQALPSMINNINRVAKAGENTLKGLSPDSELYIDLSATIRELRETSRSFTALAEMLEDNPNSLLLGR